MPIVFLEEADSAVATPATGKVSLFVDSADGIPAVKDDAGTVTSLAGIPGPGVPTGGTANQVLSKINGTDFNTQWSTPVAYTGTAGSITLTGSAFSIDAAYVGQTSITTLGTVATGTWNATAISAVKGGTGQTVYAVGDILYASTTTALSKLTAGSNGFVLTIAAGVPTWAAAPGLTNPMTTAEDLIVGGASGTPTRQGFAANTFPARASTGGMVAKTISDFSLTVLDDANQAAWQATLALVPGTNVQAYDADLVAIAGLTATTDNFIQSKSSAWASRTVAQVSVDLQGTGLITDAVGFRTVPQNSQSTAYTFVAADSAKHVLHPAADTTARIFTVPANSSVAYPVGTAITVVNQNAAGVITIAITSDTMRLAGAGTTGSRTLAANGIATLLKITSTEWIASGPGLT